jgi:hypothetical protein
MDKNSDGVPAEIEQAWREEQWFVIAKMAIAHLENRSVSNGQQREPGMADPVIRAGLEQLVGAAEDRYLALENVLWEAVKMLSRR